VRRCYNCGAVLQTKNKKAAGFIDPKTLADTPLDKIIFCDRCYKDAKFHFEPSQASVSPDFLTMLLDARASDAFIVYVIDLFSFECSFVKEVIDAIQRLGILVIANKRDLLPKEASDDALREYVAHRFRVAGLPLQANDVILMSLTSSSDMTEVIKMIDERRRRHDVYVIGAAKAGKSLFLSSVIRQFKNESPRYISTRIYPGTSLAVFEIPLDGSSSAYDTPGMGIQNSFSGFPDENIVKAVTPEGPVTRRLFVLGKGESLFFGGIARADFLRGPKKKTEAAVYMSPKVEVKKIIGRNKTDEIFNELIQNDAHGRAKIVPTTPLVTGVKDMDAFDFPIKESGRRDIGIAGLGWFSFVGEGQTFRVYVPKGIGVYGSRAKIV
jgi:ribosome biogenesis GTPase A